MTRHTSHSTAIRAALVIGLMVAGPLAALADSGTFTGINGHVTSGSVSVEQRDGGHVIVLGADFVFDGAPDPRIAFGSDGTFAPDTDFEPLKSNSGAQEYVVPAGIDPAQFNEVHLWCRKFSVGLAVAPLN